MSSLDKAHRDDATKTPTKKPVGQSPDLPSPPAAGAHAALHLTNEDATPGAGALTSHAHASGKEVDGGAG